jgi:hypothetical protein
VPKIGVQEPVVKGVVPPAPPPPIETSAAPQPQGPGFIKRLWAALFGSTLGTESTAAIATSGSPRARTPERTGEAHPRTRPRRGSRPVRQVPPTARVRASTIPASTLHEPQGKAVPGREVEMTATTAAVSTVAQGQGRDTAVVAVTTAEATLTSPIQEPVAAPTSPPPREQRTSPRRSRRGGRRRYREPNDQTEERRLVEKEAGAPTVPEGLSLQVEQSLTAEQDVAEKAEPASAETAGLGSSMASPEAIESEAARRRPSMRHPRKRVPHRSRVRSQEAGQAPPPEEQKGEEQKGQEHQEQRDPEHRLAPVVPQPVPQTLPQPISQTEKVQDAPVPSEVHSNDNG